MKSTLAIALLLLGTALAFQDNKPKDGNAALGQLQREGDEVYVYLFTHPNGVNNAAYRQFLSDQMQGCPSNIVVHYGEISMTDDKFKSFRETTKVEDQKTKHPNDHNPTVFFMRSGVGEWIHGPLAQSKFKTDFAAVCPPPA